MINFALQTSWIAYVRFGSKADIVRRSVRFTLKSRHRKTRDTFRLLEREDALILRLTARLHFCTSADAAPAGAGAYILQIDLDEPVLVKTANKPRAELSPGRYFYCGSANGPGGLRSRLARHMRQGKSVHWHIDQLTERGTVTGAWTVCNGRECDLVAMLAPLPMPVPGFGSSDCSRCRSHLLCLPAFEELTVSSLVLMRK